MEFDVDAAEIDPYEMELLRNRLLEEVLTRRTRTFYAPSEFTQSVNDFILHVRESCVEAQLQARSGESFLEAESWYKILLVAMSRIEMLQLIEEGRLKLIEQAPEVDLN